MTLLAERSVSYARTSASGSRSRRFKTRMIIRVRTFYIMFDAISSNTCLLPCFHRWSLDSQFESGWRGNQPFNTLSKLVPNLSKHDRKGRGGGGCRARGLYRGSPYPNHCRRRQRVCGFFLASWLCAVYLAFRDGNHTAHLKGFRHTLHLTCLPWESVIGEKVSTMTPIT